ncbi:hypothetical protein [Nocardia arthritidis]|uniref:Secreted protein n=1 Tax=Nocardia arthritidis TaxID=228602 RepID=A0A6G9YPS9_9NOCA|nr:hypothetical protein [Nocardia arthritidis]QIS15212.1 hypothetical protein F5544_36920 [Nocardia arthritidis]
MRVQRIARSAVIATLASATVMTWTMADRRVDGQAMHWRLCTAGSCATAVQLPASRPLGAHPPVRGPQVPGRTDRALPRCVPPHPGPRTGQARSRTTPSPVARRCAFTAALARSNSARAADPPQRTRADDGVRIETVGGQHCPADRTPDNTANSLPAIRICPR